MSSRTFAAGALALATISVLAAACQSGFSIGGVGSKKSDEPRGAERPGHQRPDDKADEATVSADEAEDADLADADAKPARKSGKRTLGKAGEHAAKGLAEAKALDACYARLVDDPSLNVSECQAARDAYFRSRGVTGPSDDDSRAAARALFGQGLDIKTSGDTISIKDGALDRGTVERYAREFYFPAILQNPAAPVTGLFRHRRDLDNQEEYESLKEMSAHRKWGFMLTEPTSRMGLCIKLADELTEINYDYELMKWCAREAQRAARLPVYLYQPGKPRSIEPDTEQDEYPIDGAAYVPRKDGSGWHIQVAVAGTTPIDTYAIHRSLVYVATNDPQKEEGEAMRKELMKMDEKRRTAALKGLARSVGARGKFMWNDVPQTDPWKPVEPMKTKVPQCQSLQLMVWEPQKKTPKRQNGWYLSVEVDGDECLVEELFGFTDGTGPSYRTRLADQCGAKKEGGQHKIKSVLRQLIYYNTHEKRARISADKIDVYEVRGSKPGKAVLTDSLTCKGGLTKKEEKK